jgi:pyridoxamine 5'-phosphate oxidase
MSEAGRRQFTWPQPGLDRDSDYGAFSQQPPGPHEAPASTFCLLLFDVGEVDHLKLLENERRVYCSKLLEDTGARVWTEKNVNP